MNINLEKIQYHTLLDPLRNALSFQNQTLIPFLTKCSNKDNSVFTLINAFAQYGNYGVIIPLNEIMSAVLSEDQLEWWAENFAKLPYSHQIQKISLNFHNNLIDSNFFSEDILSMSLSLMDVFLTLWKAYPKDLQQLIKDHPSCAICIMIPGTFQYNFDADFLDIIENYTLPHLFELIEKQPSVFSTDPIVKAIHKEAVYYYSSELGQHYKRVISKMVTPVLNLNFNELTSKQYDAYANILKDIMTNNAAIAYNLSLSWIDKLVKLCTYIDFYQLEPVSVGCRMLQYCVPVLMQCVGLDQPANQRIMELMNRLNTRENSDEIILLALYRAVCVGEKNTRSSLISRMKIVFDVTAPLNPVIRLLEDILVFYEELTKEIPLRFTTEGLAQLKASVEYQYNSFYTIYELYNAHPTSTLLDDVHWLSEKLFANEAIISFMKSKLEIVKNTNIEYSIRLQTVYEFNQLFSNLTAHLGRDTRVRLYPCLQILGFIPSEEDRYPKDEIFRVYNHQQEQELIALNKRFRAEIQHIPNFTSVAQFEHLDINDANEPSDTLIKKITIMEQRITNIEEYHIAFTSIINKLTQEGTQSYDIFMQALMNNRTGASEISEKISDISKSPYISKEMKEQLEQLHTFFERPFTTAEEYLRDQLRKRLIETFESFLGLIPYHSQFSRVFSSLVNLGKSINSLLDEVIP